MSLPYLPAASSSSADRTDDARSIAVDDVDDYTEEAPVCRICRSNDVDESMSPQALYNPCRCRGSMKYVHSTCLQEWLLVTGKEQCELCASPLHFTRVFAPMPDRLPPLLILRKVLHSSLSTTVYALRAVLVLVTWLGLFPYSVLFCARFYFKAAESSAVFFAWAVRVGGRYTGRRAAMKGVLAHACRVRPMSSLMAARTCVVVEQRGAYRIIFDRAIAEILRGQLACVLVAIVFVATFLLREFVLQNANLLDAVNEGRADLDDAAIPLHPHPIFVQRDLAPPLVPHHHPRPPLIETEANQQLPRTLAGLQTDPIPLIDGANQRLDWNHLLEIVVANTHAGVAPDVPAVARDVLIDPWEDIDDNDDAMFTALGGDREVLDPDYDEKDDVVDDWDQDLDEEEVMESLEYERHDRMDGSEKPYEQHGDEGSIEDALLNRRSSRSPAPSVSASHFHASPSPPLRRFPAPPRSGSLGAPDLLINGEAVQPIPPFASSSFDFARATSPGSTAPAPASTSASASASSSRLLPVAPIFTHPPILEFNPVGGAGLRAEEDNAAAARRRRRRRRERHDHGRADRDRDQANGWDSDDDDEADSDDAESDDEQMRGNGIAVAEDGRAQRQHHPDRHDDHHHHHHHHDDNDDDDFGGRGGGREDFIDDVDGVLEAIGMKGPIRVLLQNFGIMSALVSAALGTIIWIPLTIGKSFVAGDAIRLFTLPLKVVRTISDPTFDALLSLPIKLLRSSFLQPSISRASSSSAFLVQALSSFFPSSLTFSASASALSSSSSAPTSEVIPSAKLLPSLISVVRATLSKMQSSWMSMAVNDYPIDRARCLLLGYLIISAIVIVYISNLGDFSKMFKSTIKQNLTVLKVVVFVTIEIWCFPSLCGTILSLVTLPLFDTTLSSRMEHHIRSPWSGVFGIWLVGTLWMFMFSCIVDVFRKISRPGVMFWVRDPDDLDFQPVKEIVERKSTVQARKIAFSAMLYGLIITTTCSTAVWTLRLVVGRLRWTYQPLCTVPIDLIIFRFVLPFVLNQLDPRSRIKSMFVRWAHLCARKLRLTSFLFGKRIDAEEHSRSWFSLSKSKRMALVRDGGFARVPAFDGIRVPQGKKRRMILRVAEDGTPFEGDLSTTNIIVQQIIEMVTTRTRDKYQIVYLPPSFRVRVGLFAAALWLGSSIALVSIIIPPMLLGRYLFSFVIPQSTIVHDLYSVTIGSLCLLLVPLAHQLVTVTISSRIRYAHLVNAAQCILAVFAAGVVLPILTSIYLDLYILIPCTTRAPVAPSYMPQLDVVQSWSMGLILLSILHYLARSSWTSGTYHDGLIAIHKAWKGQRLVIAAADGVPALDVIDDADARRAERARDGFRRGKKEPQRMEAVRKLNRLVGRLVLHLTITLIIPTLFAFLCHALIPSQSPSSFYDLARAANSIASLLHHGWLVKGLARRMYANWIVRVKEDEFLVERVLQNYVPVEKSEKAKGKEKVSSE